MRRYIATLLAAVTAVAVMFTACGHDSPPERDGAVTRPGNGNGGNSGGNSENGGGNSGGSGEGSGQRPGVGGSNDFDRELADDTWRVTLPGASLRYDRGGVLFATLPDGSVRVSDLDGADEVLIVPGKENADSTLTGSRITVNGMDMQYSEIKMMRRGEGRIWYRLTDSSAGRWVLVIP